MCECLPKIIVPLLEEYCYEDYGALARISGPSTSVDETQQRVREEFFAPGKKQDLVRALLELAPEIVTEAPIIGGDDEPEEIAEGDESRHECRQHSRMGNCSP